MRVPGQKSFVPANKKNDRGHDSQGVRRGCKGLKPQQHTQGPLLQVPGQKLFEHRAEFLSFLTKSRIRHEPRPTDCFTFEMELEMPSTKSSGKNSVCVTSLHIER
jgi:hypothetical protein